MNGFGCINLFGIYLLGAYKGPESLLGIGMQWLLACSMALPLSSYDAWLCNMMEGAQELIIAMIFSQLLKNLIR